MNSIVTINTKFPRFILCPPCLDNTCSKKNRSLRLTSVSLYKTKHLNDLQNLIIVVNGLSNQEHSHSREKCTVGAAYHRAYSLDSTKAYYFPDVLAASTSRLLYSSDSDGT